ncbi:exopolyphosphatase / guanosine-5'-triphosphate,3'-diphosphate pyrophosphatase [Methylobacterium sp. 174MFSha1.1]|uniref:Ppx/GppA phosphatase family protein n=1 Tax=Methylobacterium sp. 174MFSha1.1 TaxID=1502749 RepID=UPI0008F08D2D|nr:Ppx/GppA phosphatase family protein [Methylobacterium sp. 174MFSha1.1]SFU79904.1 exopolyphosphatase / guanosine-5'-triphosphate,3'-diphosphate pyrophosphatase [Methylobacterium sp. 174MFSha1.1]
MRDETVVSVPARAAEYAETARATAPPPHPAGDDPPRRPDRRAYAALDLGTNNCRLLIAEPAPYGFRVIDAFSRIVRLGEGLGSTDRLSDGAIERTVDALAVCLGKMRSRGVVRAKSIATAACRLAVNGPAFVDRVHREVGLDLEVVDRRTEAYLAVTGCAALADRHAESVVIFDIGGGSTEIVWLDGSAALARSADPTLRIRAWDSLPVGVVTLAERYGGADVTRPVFEGMVEEVADRLTKFALIAGAAAHAPNFHLLGTSGTVTTLAATHLRLPRYDRRRIDGLWMRDREVTDAIDGLLATRLSDRAQNPCIGRDRADLVLAGCAILEAIRRAFPSERLRIADRGLREGLLMNMMREDGVWRRGVRPG